MTVYVKTNQMSSKMLFRNGPRRQITAIVAKFLFRSHKAQYIGILESTYLRTLNYREPLALARTALKRQPCRSAVCVRGVILQGIMQEIYRSLAAGSIKCTMVISILVQLCLP